MRPWPWGRISVERWGKNGNDYLMGRSLEYR
jgi:hypothetical protein